MSKKMKDMEMPIASTLIIPKQQVIELVTKQIDAAQTILSMQVPFRLSMRTYDMFSGGKEYKEYDVASKVTFTNEINKWDARNIDILTRIFQDHNNTDRAGYENAKLTYIVSDYVEEEKQNIRRCVSYLEGFIGRLDLIPCKLEDKLVVSQVSEIKSKKVFIVHGHDISVRTEVENFVRSIGYEPVILCKRADMGNTIIEKIEREAQDVCYSIVIYTSCDLGKDKNSDELHPRARQNVVFEHGFMCAHLGRLRVTALLEPGVEQPGDLQGVIYKPLDENGLWKFNVAKEMVALGLDVDITKIS